MPQRSAFFCLFLTPTDSAANRDPCPPPILERLDIEPKHWLFLTQHFESQIKGLMGTAYKLKQVCKKLGYQRTPGLKNCQTYFP